MRFIAHSSIALALMIALGACRSPEHEHESSATHQNIPCTCGTPEADMDGCAHPACLSGEGNPDNPDCVCGPLSFSGQKEK